MRRAIECLAGAARYTLRSVHRGHASEAVRAVAVQQHGPDISRYLVHGRSELGGGGYRCLQPFGEKRRRFKKV